MTTIHAKVPPSSDVKCLPHLAKHGITDPALIQKLQQRIWSFYQVPEEERKHVFLAAVFPFPPELRTRNDLPFETESKIHPPQPTPGMVPYQLLMVGILPKASPRLQALRGAMIDTFGHDNASEYLEFGVAAPNYIEVHSQKLPTPNNGVYTFRDVQKRRLNIKAENAYMLREFDGFQLRVFRYYTPTGYIDFVCSPYRFNAVNSWIPPVAQIWNANNGPSHNELFPPTGNNCSIVYHFQILHPTLSLASWLEYPPRGQEFGCLYYQGVSCMVDSNFTWIPSPEISTFDLHTAMNEGKIYFPEQISLSHIEANNFLIDGYHPNFNEQHKDTHSFLKSGESILIISLLIDPDDPNEIIPVRVKVLSPAYGYRQVEIFDTFGSFRRAYATLMVQAPNIRRLFDHHPLVNPLSNIDMKKLSWEEQLAKAFDTKELANTFRKIQTYENVRRDWLRTLFYILSPPHYRVQISDVVETVRKMYHEVGEWLIKVWTHDHEGCNVRRASKAFAYMNRKYHYDPGRTYQEIHRLRMKQIESYLYSQQNYDYVKRLNQERIRLEKQIITAPPSAQDIVYLIPDPRQADRNDIRDQKKKYIRHLRETDQIDEVMERQILIPIGSTAY